MIHVFFVPGMFGSTIEYIFRSFSNELDPVTGKILADGSMHSFKKLAHFLDVQQIDSFFNSDNTGVVVTTPIYPFKNHHLEEILERFDSRISDLDSCILMHAESLADAELNMLFWYHKISVGQNTGLETFCNGNQHNIIGWNPAYTDWKQMQQWELREWISISYVVWVQEWRNSQHLVSDRFLTVRNSDFLSNTVGVVTQLFNHCKLTPRAELSEFLNTWRAAQTYVVDEFELLNDIVERTVSNHPLEWKPINIIAEAIVQQRLRALGYEIRCDGLNIFPTDSETLYNLLEKV